MDCTEKGPCYVCLDFSTFVCAVCSGIHREFGHRVKSISMSTFKPEEITKMQTGGNDIARQIWLARWSPGEYPEPETGDQRRIREFMRAKYQEKRWYSRDAQEKIKPQPPTPPATEPLSNLLGNNLPPLAVGATKNTEDWSDFASAPQQQQRNRQVQGQGSQQNAFGQSQPLSPQQQQQQYQQPAVSPKKPSTEELLGLFDAPKIAWPQPGVQGGWQQQGAQQMMFQPQQPQMQQPLSPSYQVNQFQSLSLSQLSPHQIQMQQQQLQQQQLQQQQFLLQQQYLLQQQQQQQQQMFNRQQQIQATSVLSPTYGSAGLFSSQPPTTKPPPPKDAFADLDVFGTSRQKEAKATPKSTNQFDFL
eukprot:TRINITY_DN419_c0_g4_i1.p1 TRINITY_DN419_c0_g4~~TRINITY_DN419_c0_g4_i1.p1  ORF type:complete len:390 (+),score=108.60 TRINITY_DN419_c0_g4_i1:92-1171(+)